MRRGDDVQVSVVERHDAAELFAQPRPHHREITEALTGRGGNQALDPHRDLVRLPGRRQTDGDAEGVFLQVGLGGILHRDDSRSHAFGQTLRAHEQAQGVPEAGRPDGRGGFAQAARRLAARQGQQRARRGCPDQASEADGLVARTDAQPIQVPASPDQLGRYHLFANIARKSTDLVEKERAQVSLGGQAVEPTPCHVVGARLRQAAEIGGREAAGQRAQGRDTCADGMVGTERCEQVGVRGRKLGLHPARVPALPEAERRQGHVRAEQGIENGAGGAQATEDGFDGDVIGGKFAGQLGHHRFQSG